jgi:glycylpeptide N-tetradecanoyltransferase
MSLAD